MQRQGLRRAAADRRRHHQPRPHRDQDRPHYGAGGLRAGRLPRVGVVTNLLSEGQRAGYAAEVAADYEKMRAQHANKKGVTLVKLADARANAFQLEPRPGLPPGRRPQLGVQSFDIDLAELVGFHRLGPLLPDLGPGRQLPEDPRRRHRRRDRPRAQSDAEAMLARMVAEQDTGPWVRAKAVFGLFPANAVGDDIEIYADETRSEVLMSWHGLRQQHERPAGKPNYCLADFVAGKASGVPTGSAPSR